MQSRILKNVTFTPITFTSDVDLLNFAGNYLVGNRLASLNDDISLCMTMDNKKKEQYAPFPALLYCFSIIDLLGALVAGHATSGGSNTNAKAYMKRFMQTNGKPYEQWQCDLLQGIYRHKIVHLSEPKAAFLFNGKVLGWRHDERPEVAADHLQIINPRVGDPLKFVEVYDTTRINLDGGFIINITRFKDEIAASVTRTSDGYLAQLAMDRQLKEHFVTAINQIFDPAITR